MQAASSSASGKIGNRALTVAAKNQTPNYTDVFVATRLGIERGVAREQEIMQSSRNNDGDTTEYDSKEE